MKFCLIFALIAAAVAHPVVDLTSPTSTPFPEEIHEKHELGLNELSESTTALPEEGPEEVREESNVAEITNTPELDEGSDGMYEVEQPEEEEFRQRRDTLPHGEFPEFTTAHPEEVPEEMNVEEVTSSHGIHELPQEMNEDEAPEEEEIRARRQIVETTVTPIEEGRKKEKREAEVAPCDEDFEHIESTTPKIIAKRHVHSDSEDDDFHGHDEEPVILVTAPQNPEQVLVQDTTPIVFIPVGSVDDNTDVLDTEGFREKRQASEDGQIGEPCGEKVPQSFAEDSDVEEIPRVPEIDQVPEEVQEHEEPEEEEH